MKISCDHSSTQVRECNNYTWSNEPLESYRKCFGEMDILPTNVSSVGGGDHILTALLYFDSIKVINNIDVSPIGLLSSLVKFVVLSNGTYGDWFELLTGSILESRILKLLDCIGMEDTYKSLCDIYTEKTHGVNPLSSMSFNTYNSGFFNGITIFTKIKNKVNKVNNFNSILHDIYNIDLTHEGIVKEQSDLFLISNAYYYIKSRIGSSTPIFIDKSLKANGYIVASSAFDWFRDPRIKVTNMRDSIINNTWQFHVIRKIK